jgi:hypothetical protein
MSLLDLGFPWKKPASAAKARKSNGFTDTITDKDYREAVERNQAAHAIVVDVASDAFTGFKAGALDANIQQLFDEMISAPMRAAYMFCRMYGYCGLLIGYADDTDLSVPTKGGAKIEYLQAIPKDWIEEIVYKKRDGYPVLPLTPESYKVNISTTPQTVDASRMVLLSNPSLDAGSIEGEPSLKAVFDLITVIKSMDWGVGQAMWRHGGGLTAFIVADTRDQQTQIDAIDELVTDINAMTTLTLPAGTQMYSELNGGLNPEPYYRVIMQQLSLGTRIPMSILIGSQAGALSASMKDRHDYYELLTDIQEDVLTPALVEILQRFQTSNQLPGGNIVIEWDEMPSWIEDMNEPNQGVQ